MRAPLCPRAATPSSLCCRGATRHPSFPGGRPCALPTPNGLHNSRAARHWQVGFIHDSIPRKDSQTSALLRAHESRTCIRITGPATAPCTPPCPVRPALPRAPRPASFNPPASSLDVASSQAAT